MELKPKYKQTEAGAIPKDWKVQSLDKLSDRIMVGIASAATHAYRNKGIPLLRNQNIKPGYLDDRDIIYIDPAYEVTFRNKRLQAGDLLTARTGYPGTTCVISLGYQDAQSFTTLITRPLQHLIDSYYLCYYINSEQGQRFFDQKKIGGGQQNVNAGTLKQMPIPFPSLAEQRAIATALSDMDALLAAQDQFIAKKRDIKQAVMQRLLTGKQRLPGFSGEWECKTIEQLEEIGIVKLSRGQVISKKDIDEVPGSCPIYSSSVKNNGLFGCYGKFMFDEELITWSVDGGGHFFYRDKHKFSVTNVCGFMRVDATKLSYRFLAAQLQLLHSSMTFDYQDKAHPSVIRKAYKVLVPPLREQAAIAAVLSDMDAEIDALRQRRDKTQMLKQGMMQELLTGRTRLV